MLRKSIVLLLSLILSIYSYTQDCENYFIYQQKENLSFTFLGFMVEPAQSLYNWDFGDGNTGTGISVSHTFPPGVNVYEVCLYTESYDSLGNACYDTTCQDITAGNPPGCVAFFFANQSPGNPLAWSFSDFSSGLPTSWSWTFGDGNTSNNQSPIHTYDVEGTYQVCLTITDTVNNCQDEYCEEIIVTGNSGGGDCESDFTYTSNDLLTFDFSAYMLDTTQLDVDYQWDFGDGNFGSGQNITHTYQLPGAAFVPVCLTTTFIFPGGDSCEFITCRDVYVGSPPNCQALFSWVFGSQPLSVDFTDNSVGGPTSWHWDFDDSTYSNLQHPTHVFYRDGIFNVCLTITNDSTNCNSTICSDVHVTNVPPPVDCSNTITTTPGADMYTFDFHGEAFSNGNNVSAATTFSWNLGDGNTASGQDITHTFGSAGSYAVTLATVSILNTTSDTCIAYGFDSVIVVNTSYCIGGNVSLNTPIGDDDGYVQLMQYDATYGNLLNVESIPFDNTGYYLFEDINFSNGISYYVQADLSPQSTHFGDYVPTYHSDAIFWTEALVAVVEECPPILNHDIIMQESNSYASGINSISGIVYSDDTKAIIEGMEILLLNEAMEALTYVFTDANGMFEFNLLADGSYYIYPERVGIETSGFMVTLDSETPSVEMTIVVGDGTASLSVEEYSVISIMHDIYPNPSSGMVNISLSAEKDVEIEVSVFNQLGQQMLLQSEHLSKGVNNIEVHTNSLPESVYYMRLQAPESKPLMRTFVKVN